MYIRALEECAEFGEFGTKHFLIMKYLSGEYVSYMVAKDCISPRVGLIVAVTTHLLMTVIILSESKQPMSRM